jgi:hypothetical protein
MEASVECPAEFSETLYNKSILLWHNNSSFDKNNDNDDDDCECCN